MRFAIPSRFALARRSTSSFLSDPAAIPPNSMAGGRIVSGLVLSEHSALQISTVMACVRELGGDVSGLALDEQERRDNRWGDVDPSPLIADPFIDLDPAVGWFQVMASLLLRGNSWNRIVERDKLMRPTKLLPLHPDTVSPRLIDNRRVLYVNGKQVPTADVLHIPGIVLPGGWTGLDPIMFNAQAFGLALAAETYGAQYFANGTVLSGVLQSDQPLDEDAVKRTLQLWRKTHGGLRNAHLPAVLGNGLKWQPLTVAPNEAQFLETRDYQRHEIAGIFGVDPDRVGAVGKHASQGGGKGGETRELRYVKHTVRFWAGRIEGALTRALQPGRRGRFNVDSLLRSDLAARYSSYSAARAGGWLTTNEIRELEDRDPLEGGDNLFQPLNSATTDGTTTATGEPRDTEETP